MASTVGLWPCFSPGKAFERFLKLTRAQVVLFRSGNLPSAKDVRGWGHRLLELLDATVVELEGDVSFTARPAIRDDLRFLRDDKRFRSLFAVLDEFATGGRYHNLDVMLDGRSTTKHPVDRWSEYERELFDEDPAWLDLMKRDPAGFIKAWYPHLSKMQTETLQRAARAIARAWTLGPAKESGRQLTSIVSRFLFLTDEQLSSCPRRPQ